MKVGSKNQIALALLGFLCFACGDQNPEITSPHRIRTQVDQPRINASEAERFGMRPVSTTKNSDAASNGAPSEAPSPEDFFEWTTPEGWELLASNQFRIINLKVGQVECTLGQVTPRESVLNINRWRQQMGAEQLDPDAVETLKVAQLFERDAYRMDVSGSFTGMTGGTQEDARMLTVIADFPQFALTVKMVGPRAEVEAQTENFAIFVNSLAFKQNIGAAQEDPHGAPAKAAADKPADAPASNSDDLAWEVPEGWTKSAPRSMRHVSFEMAANSGVECYVTLLGGQAGGVMGNLNRWLGQVGLDHLDQAGIDALPRIDMLAEQAHLLEAIGESDAIMATLVMRPGDVIFVKMTGSPEGVVAQKDNFIQFCASLHAN